MSPWAQVARMIQARIGAPAPPVRQVSEIAATRHRGHSDEINAPGGGRLLSEREIVRALWMYRYDRRRRVPIKALAEACQLHRSVLYDAMHAVRVSERASAILSTVIGQIADDRLRFRRVGQVWEPDYRFPPDPLPPPQPRLVRATDFVEWSRCQSCGGLWFSPVIMNGAPWFFLRRMPARSAVAGAGRPAAPGATAPAHWSYIIQWRDSVARTCRRSTTIASRRTSTTTAPSNFQASPICLAIGVYG